MNTDHDASPAVPEELTGVLTADPPRFDEGDVPAIAAASFGFDAITVALLGRSRPWGTFFAGLLFGALKAGGFLMQSLTQTPIDIVLVVQSLIVLLIAAPPLVRAVFRLPSPTGRPRRPRPARTTTEEVTA